jgi:hypothetical protein
MKGSSQTGTLNGFLSETEMVRAEIPVISETTRRGPHASEPDTNLTKNCGRSRFSEIPIAIDPPMEFGINALLDELFYRRDVRVCVPLKYGDHQFGGLRSA